MVDGFDLLKGGMSEEIPARVSEYGFALLRKHTPNASTVSVLKQFGEVINLPGTTEVQVLRPRTTTEAPRIVYSGHFGYDEFPLHTDVAHWFIPPRYLVLRCVCGVDDVETRLLDGRTVFERIGRDALHSALVQSQRPSGYRKTLLRILELLPPSAELFRWDTVSLHPSTPKSQTIWEAVRENIESATHTSVVLDSPGDTLIIDNWRMLHGRSTVPTASAHRRIERGYLGTLR